MSGNGCGRILVLVRWYGNGTCIAPPAHSKASVRMAVYQSILVGFLTLYVTQSADLDTRKFSTEVADIAINLGVPKLQVTQPHSVCLCMLVRQTMLTGGEL